MTTPMDDSNLEYWAVLPAAGAGLRMGADRPKQYLPLLGKTVLEHTLARIQSVPGLTGTVVCLSAQDPYWPAIQPQPNVLRAAGGAQRSDSVRNGLRTLLDHGVPAQAWVLVHDAARPCVWVADIQRLMAQLARHPVGGLLATPVRDTLKKSDAEQQTTATVNRTGLWHALTPQMFRLGILLNALEQAAVHAVAITDDAQAMELQGHAPILVEGRADNLKITHPRDLRLAEIYLRAQAEEWEFQPRKNAPQ